MSFVVRARKESGLKSSKLQCLDSALLLRNCETGEELSDQVNLASELSDNVRSFSPTSPRSTQSAALYRPSVAFRSSSPAHVVSMDKAEAEIFTISKQTVPSDTETSKKKLALDDHTYILATDSDMEFTEDSVVDLLNLCNQDRRLGGACGRTHPIGQRTGPLVWYQKFEYAKGTTPFLHVINDGFFVVLF